MFYMKMISIEFKNIYLSISDTINIIEFCIDEELMINQNDY